MYIFIVLCFNYICTILLKCTYTAMTVMEAVYVYATKIQLLLRKCQPLPNTVKQQSLRQSRRWLLTNYNSDDYQIHTQTSVPHAICFIDEGLNTSCWYRTFVWGSQSILQSGNRKWHYPNCTVRWARLPPSLIACQYCSLASSWRGVPYSGFVHCLTLLGILGGKFLLLCHRPYTCVYMNTHLLY